MPSEQCFLRDQFDRRTKRGQVVDVRGIRTNRTRQGPLLIAGLLMSRTKVQLGDRVAGEHQGVKPPRNRFRVDRDDGCSGFDDFNRFFTDHGDLIFPGN